MLLPPLPSQDHEAEEIGQNSEDPDEQHCGAFHGVPEPAFPVALIIDAVHNPGIGGVKS